MDIETMATSAFTNLISRTDYLKPFVSEGDREPHWDGHVHVFYKASKPQKLSDARVPVQIKGLSHSDLSKDKITYPARISDLRCYLDEGGVIFVVCYVTEIGNCRLYYSALLPFDLKRIMNTSGAQGTKSICLTPLPTDPKELSRVFFDFLANRKKQYSVIDADVPLSIEEIKKQFSGQEFHFSIPYTQFKDEPLRISLPPTPGAVLPTSGYMYANLPTGATVPIAHISEVKIASSNVPMSGKITCNGTVYYNTYHSVLTEDQLIVTIGRAITYTLNKNDESSTFNFNLAGTLSQRIHDLSFLVAVIDTKEFYIEDCPVSLNNPISQEGLIFQDARDILLQHQEIQMVLKKLDIEEDFDMDILTEQDCRHLQMLAAAILYGEPVSLGSTFTYRPTAFLRLGTLSILLGICQTDQKGFYQIKPFYEMPCKIGFNTDSDAFYPASPYIPLTIDSLRVASNLSFQRMADSVCSVPHSDSYEYRVQQLFFSLLCLYDETLNQDVLIATDALSNWLYLNASEGENKVVALLNCYQSKYRQRSLNNEELTALLSITENGSHSDSIKAGAYILLDMPPAAKLHLSRLTPEDRELFSSYPIYHLLPQAE